MDRKATVFPIGTKSAPARKLNRKYNILFVLGLVSLVGFVVGELTGPTTFAEGTIVDKYRRYGKSTSYKIDVQLTSGPFRGEVVTDSVSSWDFDDYNTGQMVNLDVTKGRFTGLLHGDSATVVTKPRP